MYWQSDNTDHVFSVYDVGPQDETRLLKELWSYINTSTWGAHDVLHEVKSVAGSAPHTPLAPPAGSSVLAAFDDGAKNVAYVAANGTSVYLCSHGEKASGRSHPIK